MVPGRWGRKTAARKGPPLKPGSAVGDNNLEVLSVKTRVKERKMLKLSVYLTMFYKNFLCVSIRKNIILKVMKNSTATDALEG